MILANSRFHDRPHNRSIFPMRCSQTRRVCSDLSCRVLVLKHLFFQVQGLVGVIDRQLLVFAPSRSRSRAVRLAAEFRDLRQLGLQTGGRGVHLEPPALPVRVVGVITTGSRLRRGPLRREHLRVLTKQVVQEGARRPSALLWLCVQVDAAGA